MTKKNLFIYKDSILYNILYELEEVLKFKIYKLTEDVNLELDFKDTVNNLLITNKNIKNINNQLVISDCPITLAKLIENINVIFLSQNFQNKSKINAGKFTIDINSRNLIFSDKLINLTEKEVNIILFLLDNKKPCSITTLQTSVWGYKENLETHTVETHIYRLRKKILEKFGDDEFIIFENNGYLIKL
ncbi:winged helix-turn-helix domain-containing protein [Candidatus Pelagibacter sp.]|nr:winged helix-turn-helix domain-containing protein [Candidatus Pelagibacter sp.]